MALVNALLTSADILMLDEPTNHLDNAMSEWLEEYLIKFRGAILMVTHDRYFLDRVTNRIAVSYTHLDVYKRQAHTYMAAEGIEKAAKAKNCFVKVETRGSGGAKNVLTEEEIEAADCIIVAADAQVPDVYKRQSLS